MYLKVLGLTTFCLLSIIMIVFFVVSSGSDKELAGLMDKKSAHERYNLLVMGTDKDESRSDVMMICSIDKKDNTVNVMSVPRDTRVLIGNNYQKLNAAIGIGGDELAINKIRELTGIEIHDYVKVNFKAVEDIIDAFGGVRYNVPQDMDYEDPYQNLYIHIKAGEQKLNGEQALQLLRFRQYPMGDLQRIQVQQDFLRELVRQKANLIYIFKAKSIYKAATDNMTTTLTAGDVSSVAFGLLGMKSKDVQSFECPYYFSQSGIYVIIDKEKLQPIVEENFK